MLGEIIQIAASYEAFFILVRYANGNTRVFYETSSLRKFSKEVNSIGGSRRCLLGKDGVSSVSWFEMLDFKKLLQPGEFIVHVGCAANTCVFTSSRGRLFSSGSNQFAELGIGITPSPGEVLEIKPCIINSECVDQPFFVKTVHGDHNIVALTNDGRVFVCGYSLGRNDENQPNTLIQVKPDRSNVVFTDICAGYYTLYGLTSKYIDCQEFQSVKALLRFMI